MRRVQTLNVKNPNSYLSKLNHKKGEDINKEKSMQNENNNDESNNKNNYKELDINDIENMPIKDSNNILEKNSNQKESLVSKEKIEINFDRLYQDLKDSETEAIQTRIESYELKGFNAMLTLIEN